MKYLAKLTLLYEGKWNRADLLPLTEDLVKLQHHIPDVIEASLRKMKNDPTSNDHRALSEATLSLLLFNRRRQGEVGRLETKDFEKAEKFPCSRIRSVPSSRSY